MKLKVSSIIAIMAYHVALVNLPYISIYNYILYAFIAILLLFFAINYKVFLKKEYSNVNIFLLLFISIAFLSAIYNGNNVHRTVIYISKVLSIVLFFEYMYQKNENKKAINIFYKLTMIYCFFNDIIVFINPNIYIQHQGYYFLGNKFNISYMHIILLVLFMYLYRDNIKNNFNKKALMFFIIVISLAIFIITECTTALIGYLLLLLFIFFIPIKKVIKKPKVFLVTIIVTGFVLVFFSGILHNKLIENIIVNVLHEDIELTGRIYIYENVFNILSKSLLLGYGYGNSYEIMYDYITAPNTQNGILECILNFGVLGTTLFILFILTIVKNLKYNVEYKDKQYIILFGVYVFIILGMVEVTYDIYLITLLSMLNCGKKGIKEKIDE